jgi:signal peptide peptidase SppA
MKSAHPLIAARIFNTPLLIHPGKLDAIIAGLGERLLGQPINIIGENHVAQSKPLAFLSAQGSYSQNGYQIIDGVAVIDVGGVLAHRSQIDMQTCAPILGYDAIAQMHDAALADPAVDAILYLMDTPGGEVAGAFDLAAKIYASRGQKPMAAIASDMAASAGYLLASAVGQIAVTQTACVGSIGVVMRHVDMSEAAKQAGMNVTYVYAGDHKIDGNPFQPLPDAVRKDFQASVDKLYGMFTDAVSRQRGMDARDLVNTQARCYTGDDAVKAGLADLVSTPDQMIQTLRDQSRSRSSRAGARATHSPRSTSMSEHEQGSGGANANHPAASYTQADLDRARVEGNAQGVKTGMDQERARVSGIMAHDEAKGRSALAQTCVAQGLSVEQAGALLAASPRDVQAQASGGNEFAKAMAVLGNPKVSAATGNETSDEPTAEDLVSSMLGTRGLGAQARR